MSNEIEKYKKPSEESVQDESAMGFLDHLEELRGTLFKCVVVYAIALAIIFYFIKDITGLMIHPLADAMGSTEEARNVLRTARPMGVFSVLLQVGFFGALGISLPFFMYFFAGFVAPALTAKEKSVIIPASLMAIILFSAGIALNYYLILPLSLKFSVELNYSLSLIPLWGASDYYGLVVWSCLAVGVSFEFPLLIIILTYVGILPIELLKKSRRVVFVIMLVFVALITPGGDPISMSVMAGLMYGLYELSILISQRIQPRKEN
jgi:sec-independent protein translocase protein TatC